MAIYISGIGLISPQETIDNKRFLENVIVHDTDYFHMMEPPYKEFIPARELRRMSKVLRNGLVSAKIALEETQIEIPDAILTGSGLGCASDTEKFLTAMVENKERLLTPTSFIQSTHNTLGGSIAIGLGCHNYNMTYVNRGFSFESALMDAQLMMQTGEINSALVGGFDEMTNDHWKQIITTDQYHPDRGAKPGQGCGFFVLENEAKEQHYAQLIDIKTIYNPKLPELEAKLQEFTLDHEIDPSKLLVLMGYNGIENETKIYDHFAENIFNKAIIAKYKHLCGEYYTSTAFALWIACQTLDKQTIPDALKCAPKHSNEIKFVLIYNQFMTKEHSLILLSKC